MWRFDLAPTLTQFHVDELAKNTTAGKTAVSRPKSGTISVRADLINHFRDAERSVTLLVLAPQRRLHNESADGEERKPRFCRDIADPSRDHCNQECEFLPDRFLAAIVLS